MNEVANTHITNNSSKGVKENYNNYKKEERRERKIYTAHETVEEIFSLCRRKKPISIVMTQSNNYFAITDIQIDNFVEGFPVQLKYYRTIDSMTTNTRKVIIDYEIADSYVVHIEKKDISVYLLIIPISSNDNISNVLINKLIYYVNDSEWKELGSYNTLQYPTSSHCIYNIYQNNSYHHILFVIVVIMSLLIYTYSELSIYYGHILDTYYQYYICITVTS